MRACLAIAALAFSVLAGPAAAQFADPLMPRNEKFPERVEIGISTSEIAITSDFTGADITVFGAIDNSDELLLATGAYDIIVALEGPRQWTTVRRKERVFGIWINRHSYRFEPIPASYSMSSTRALTAISTPFDLASRDIGINNIRLVPSGGVGDGSRLNEFRDALRRIKQLNGLYQRDPSGVRFISKSLFRASVRLPASIPVGLHKVRAVLYKNGQYVMETEIPLRVTKTGIEQFIYNLAHQYALVYGFLAVALALLTGWIGSVLFRKD